MDSPKLLFSNADLKQLIVPLVIEQTLVMLVGITDTMMVSNAGEAAISGVSLVDMVNNLVATILAAVATGGAVIVSQYLGHKNQKQANLAASQLYTVSLLTSLSVTFLCLVFNKQLLRGLFGSIDDDVMGAATIYFLITSLSFPFLGLYNAAGALLRSIQKTSVTMRVSLVMNLINVVGNAIGIFVLHAGVAGVAVPTLVSRMFAAICLTTILSREGGEVRIARREVVSWHRDVLHKILYIAIPNGMENGFFELGRVIVVSIIALFGTAQIAANGVANSLDTIGITVSRAMNLAVIPIVGRCVGAGEYGQAKYYTRKLILMSHLSIVILGGATIALLPAIRLLYGLSDEAWRLTVWLVVIHEGVAMLLHPLSFNLPNTLRAAGDVRYTLAVGAFSIVFCRLLGAYLLGVVLGWKIIGVWVAMCVDWVFRSTFFIARYKSGTWMRIHLV